VPLAIARSDLMFHLVEARTRRASFLELVVERLALANVKVVLARAEEASILVDLCLARALAPPERAWQLASRLLAERGALVYWAGRSWGSEQEEALTRMGVTTQVCAAPSAEWQGSVVKMARTVLAPDPGMR
jgi:16S rRNA G527 N7-methylase RsmG